MSMPTKEQLKYWAQLESLRRQMGAASNDLHAMQRLLRVFAVSILEQDTDTRAIKVAGQTLMTFPNEAFRNKAAYMAYYRREGTWVDDALLFKVLFVLGYQPVMHLVGTEVPPYAAFVQNQANPLSIHLASHGAMAEPTTLGSGYHWERVIQTTPFRTQSNPGGGNCGLYAIAQQITQDMPKIQAALANQTPYVPSNQAASVNASQARVVTEPRAATVATKRRQELSTNSITVSQAPVVREPRAASAAAKRQQDLSTKTSSRQKPQISATVLMTPKATAPAVLTSRQPSASPLSPVQTVPPVQTERKVDAGSAATVFHSPNHALDEVTQKSIAIQTQIEQDGFLAIKDQLTSHRLSTKTLIHCYQHLMKTTEDTYLSGRLKEISKERKDETIAAVIQGVLPISGCDETELRQELIHALAREASLRDSSYAYVGKQISQHASIKNSLSSFFSEQATSTRESRCDSKPAIISSGLRVC